MSLERPATVSTTDRPRQESAARRAYAHIKERLLDGRFACGTLLSENELAQRLGLSRIPVRQALVHLEASGLRIGCEHHPAR